MLPIPFIDFIPKLMREHISDSGQAFTDEMDSIMTDLKNDILNLQRNRRIAQIPNLFLDELGFLLEAGLTNSDSAQTKREKLKDAVPAHKRRGRFDADVKPKIDAITGLSSDIISSIDSGDWIWLGNTGDDILDKKWGVWGGTTGGCMNDFGLDWIGSGNDLEIAGNILIDLGGDAGNPTAETIAKVVEEMEIDIAPAYMQIFLGFLDVDDNFITYPGGIV